MSKNLTRKGLALGAVVALGASLFAGTPASAAELLTLAPSAGTTYNTTSTSTFKLETGFTNVGANYQYLKYAITNSSQAAVNVDITTGGSTGEELLSASGTADVRGISTSTFVSFDVSDDAVDSDGDVIKLQLAAGQGAKYRVGDHISVTGVNAGSADASDKAITAVSGDTISYHNGAKIGAGLTSTLAATTGTVNLINRYTKSTSFKVRANDIASGANKGAVGSTNYLAINLSSDAYDANTTVSVQAWLDVNGNNTIDDGESTSPIREVNFKNVSDLTGSVSLVTPFVGETAIAAVVTIGGDLNYRQISGSAVKVNFSGITTDATFDGLDQAVYAAWDSVKGDFRATKSLASIGGVSSVQAGENFKAQLYVDNNHLGSATVIAADLEGAASKATAAASASAYNGYGSVVSAAGVKNTTKVVQRTSAFSLDGADAVDQASGSALVKTDARKGTFKLFVGSGSNNAGVDSAPVRITATASSALTLADAATIGGLGVYDGQTRVLNVATSATGYATVDFAGVDADSGDSISLAISVAGTDFGTYVINFADSVYTATELNNSAVRSITSGETFALQFKVVDQWGIVPANNTYRVYATPSENETRTKAADFKYDAAVVDGVATVSVIDNGVGVGTYKIGAILDTNANTLSNTAITTSIKVVADKAPATIALEKLAYGALQALDANNDGDYADTGDVDNTAKLIVDTAALSNYDVRYAVPGAVASAVVAGNKVTIAGTVKNAAAAAVAGTPVTVAAKGFLFRGATRDFVDSIVVYTAADGTFSVDAWSNVGGTQTVAITAGAATASQKLTYAAGIASAKSFTFAGTTTVQAGRVAEYKAVVVDKYGNAAQGITVSFGSTGSGYVTQTSVVTDEKGEASVKLVVGTTDSGTAVVTAKITDSEGVVLSKTATTEIGVTDAQVDIVANRVTAVASFTKGKTVAFYVDGIKKWSKTSASDADVVLNYNLKKGAHTVTVKVSGGFVTTEKFIVK